MQFKEFDSPYYAAIDRVSRTLSPKTVCRILSEPYYLGWQKLPADVFVAACIIVCLYRVCQNPSALFAFGNIDLSNFMNSNRLLEIDAMLTERLCPNCRSVDEMREDTLDEGYSFTCLVCDWQTIIKRDEVHWLKSEIPALKLPSWMNN